MPLTPPSPLSTFIICCHHFPPIFSLHDLYDSVAIAPKKTDPALFPFSPIFFQTPLEDPPIYRIGRFFFIKFYSITSTPPPPRDPAPPLPPQSPTHPIWFLPTTPPLPLFLARKGASAGFAIKTVFDLSPTCPFGPFAAPPNFFFFPP